jgi:hypothetical protein
VLTEQTEKRLREYIAKYPTEVYGKINQVTEDASTEYLRRLRMIKLNFCNNHEERKAFSAAIEAR